MSDKDQQPAFVVSNLFIRIGKSLIDLNGY